MQTQEYLNAFLLLESLLSFLTPCRSVRLLHDVIAPYCRNYLLVIGISQVRSLYNSCSVAPDLIGMNNLWDTIFSRQLRQKGLCGFSVAVPLKSNSSTKPYSSTALQSQCRTPSTVMQTSFRNKRESRRGSR